VGDGLELGPRGKELLVMRIDEANGEAPWPLTRLTLFQEIHRLAGDARVADVSMRGVAGAARQIAAGRIRIGQALETIGIEQFVWSSVRDREVPFPDIGRLVTCLPEQLAIRRVVP